MILRVCGFLVHLLVAIAVGVESILKPIYPAPPRPYLPRSALLFFLEFVVDHLLHFVSSSLSCKMDGDNIQWCLLENQSCAGQH